mmetsp:Transcript_32264/g.69715  ORF Transcript_32264/g.69715 Transcript_32264/m.69715 type:complete len:225 (-) Transcript_32264:370-1044(-)
MARTELPQVLAHLGAKEAREAANQNLGVIDSHLAQEGCFHIHISFERPHICVFSQQLINLPCQPTTNLPKGPRVRQKAVQRPLCHAQGRPLHGSAADARILNQLCEPAGLVDWRDGFVANGLPTTSVTTNNNCSLADDIISKNGADGTIASYAHGQLSGVACQVPGSFSGLFGARWHFAEGRQPVESRFGGFHDTPLVLRYVRHDGGIGGFQFPHGREATPKRI